MHGEVYFPSDEVVAQANAQNYEQMRADALADPIAYWDMRAKELIDWYEPYDKVLDDSNAPFYKWYTGGKTNLVHNAIDRHLTTANRNKVAMIWVGEPEDGKPENRRVFTYHDMNREVSKFANILKDKGIKKGDTVTIYMGRVPETVFAMLAVVKLGAIHSVVYGGFSAQALSSRINDAQSRVLITCDGAWLRGKTVNLKKIANEALESEEASVVETCIVVKRTGQDVVMQDGRDQWYHDLYATASAKCATEVMDSEDPMFILYTSGTTGRPKGVLHTCGGYQVYTATTLKYVMDIKPEDRWWCAADPGWITGHSYIVYSPLILGATGFIYEGAPTYPDPGRWWRLIEEYGLTHLYTAPTAIRGLMRFGDEHPKKSDLSSLRLLGSVGEPINPEAWKWFYKEIGGERCPIMDTWWQTETGGFMITPTPSVPLKPGSGTKPFTGIDADIVRRDGSSAEPNEDGYLVVKTPWPGMARTVWGDPDRYKEVYWSTFADQGWYFTGDSAKKDEDDYIWIIGRMDDVIKVSGYRLGTAEVESAVGSFPVVAESACIGVPDELRGNVIHAFCILNAGEMVTDTLEQEIKDHVGKVVGPIAKPSKVHFVDALPKTRSGKIMRRLLKAQVLGKPLGDTSTLAD